MEPYFASGHAADVILAVLAIEALVLSRRGWGLADVAALLLPAAVLVLALRAALTDMAWPWIAAPLALAFPAHLWDLARRRPRG